jgi:chitinase
MRWLLSLLVRAGVAVMFVLSGAGVLQARPLVVAYVPNWIELGKFAGTIPYAQVTHLNVAFENPVDDGGTMSFAKDSTILIEKARAQGVKVLVSIGGGSASGDKVLKVRYAALLAEGKRGAFAGRLVDYVREHGFDGLDVDLEGPSIDGNYGAFIAELAGRLRPAGKLLTAALSKGYGGDKVPAEVFAHFDFVNIMAYDGSGYWQPDAPGPHSSHAFAVENAAYWLQRGLPKAKAVLGVPFYGYGFGKAFQKRDYPYAAIVRDYPGAEERDEAGFTIYYNGLPTMRGKCRYVLDEGLAGVMIWSLDGDAPGSKSLLGAIHATLSPPP